MAKEYTINVTITVKSAVKDITPEEATRTILLMEQMFNNAPSMYRIHINEATEIDTPIHKIDREEPSQEHTFILAGNHIEAMTYIKKNNLTKDNTTIISESHHQLHGRYGKHNKLVLYGNWRMRRVDFEPLFIIAKTNDFTIEYK